MGGLWGGAPDGMAHQELGPEANVMSGNVRTGSVGVDIDHIHNIY